MLHVTCFVIYLGADHRGYNLKEKIKGWLAEWGFQHEDIGPFEYNKDDDFPDFGQAVGEKVSKDAGSRGVVICGSGIGIGVAANKIKGIRAGTAGHPAQAESAVHDEDMNVLSLSADFTTEDEAKEIVRAFVNAKFGSEERYNRRLEKIKKLEND